VNADAFRHLYAYHFTINRKIWDQCIVPLTDEQFRRKVEYSVGSIRNQVVHMLNIDDRWFSGLRGEPVPGFLNPVHYARRAVIRQMWDDVEAKMRDYLDTLRDDMLFAQPFQAEGDPMMLWQVLIHVANHGTDHRAQLLFLLNEVGVKTFAQDYFYFVKGHM
jgi:uncharacterized damage-inducible protein DinB